MAADAFLARRPEATSLCGELGLTDALVAPQASGASLWVGGRLRMMPDGVSLGVPTRAWPLIRSGILSPSGLLRAAVDLVAPHHGDPRDTADRSVGDIVGDRLGHEVVERLVDPLVGGINAGGVTDLSAEATFPPLLAADRAVRQPGAGPAAPAVARPDPAGAGAGARCAADAGVLVARRRHRPPARRVGRRPHHPGGRNQHRGGRRVAHSAA